VSDIKATVDYIEQLRVEDDDDAFPIALLKAWPSLLAELRRCWAIEEAARRYREALDVFNRQFVDRACPELAMAKQDACNALFAALPPRKPSGGEEVR